jgi:hypothetical protein
VLQRQALGPRREAGQERRQELSGQPAVDDLALEIGSRGEARLGAGQIGLGPPLIDLGFLSDALLSWVEKAPGFRGFLDA